MTATLLIALALSTINTAHAADKATVDAAIKQVKAADPVFQPTTAYSDEVDQATGLTTHGMTKMWRASMTCQSFPEGGVIGYGKTSLYHEGRYLDHSSVIVVSVGAKNTKGENVEMMFLDLDANGTVDDAVMATGGHADNMPLSVAQPTYDDAMTCVATGGLK